MNTTARPVGRPALPPEQRIDGGVTLNVRLPPLEEERTRAHAMREGRSLSNFVRHIYLRGLAQYEAEQARIANPVSTY